jgi:hypothetical protein
MRRCIQLTLAADPQALAGANNSLRLAVTAWLSSPRTYTTNACSTCAVQLQSAPCIVTAGENRNSAAWEYSLGHVHAAPLLPRRRSRCCPPRARGGRVQLTCLTKASAFPSASPGSKASSSSSERSSLSSSSDLVEEWPGPRLAESEPKPGAIFCIKCFAARCSECSMHLRVGPGFRGLRKT